MAALKMHISDFKFLQTLTNPLDLSTSDILLERDFYIIILPKEVLESILDKVSDILAQKGFDENYSPNSLGIRIEGLIDQLSRIVYE